MIYPSCEKAAELADGYNVIPICKEIYSDVSTTINLLKKLSSKSSKCFLLESVEGGERWARYSFLGFDPIMRVTCKNKAVQISADGTTTEKKTDKPLDVLREIQKSYKAPAIENMPPFTGGFVGYFAYSMIKYAEPKLKIREGDFNDFDVMLFDKVIAFDHQRQKICIIANVKADNIAKNYSRAVAEINEIIGIIHGRDAAEDKSCEEQVEFTCNISKEDYCAVIDKAKEYIFDGDIFQAVISRKFSAPYQGSLLNAYRVLRTTNPSPYMVYMKIDGDEIICSSPETLVKLNNGRLTTFPVAGSRPRGKTAEEDLQLEKELLADEKELSEHNMLVDLGRNDLGKISQFSSVKVTEYMMVHRYSKIMHICSQVESDILKSCDGYSAIEAVLPAGTLSGAPKIRACEIIDELEPEPRGIYGGAIGYIDFTGNIDTCIAIRMAVKKNGRVYVQAGGGIVADSVPQTEYEESGNKAAAVINAICKAAEVNE